MSFCTAMALYLPQFYAISPSLPNIWTFSTGKSKTRPSEMVAGPEWWMGMSTLMCWDYSRGPRSQKLTRYPTIDVSAISCKIIILSGDNKSSFFFHKRFLGCHDCLNVSLHSIALKRFPWKFFYILLGTIRKPWWYRAAPFLSSISWSCAFLLMMKLRRLRRKLKKQESPVNNIQKSYVAILSYFQAWFHQDCQDPSDLRLSPLL